MAATARASASSKVTQLCRLIEQSEQLPTLERLAAQVGLSTFYTQRMFKAAMGVTPRAYAAALRAARLRTELSAGQSITQASYQSGYQSSGRFYADAAKRLGMTPAVYRAGAPNMSIRFAVGSCSLGDILVAATGRGVCAILMGDDPTELVHDLERRFPAAELMGSDASFEQLVARVVGLVERPRATHDIPLDMLGTAFQERVWQALLCVPSGATVSYAELAEAIGQPSAARAVAGACAANHLAVAIPCHRVVRTDGNLSGYRWGVDRKRALLARERT